MNILVVTPYFYPEGGGAERYVYNIAKELAKDNKLIVLTDTMKERKIEEINQIKVIRLKSLFRLSTMPINCKLLQQIIKIIKDEGIDIIDVNYSLPYYPDISVLLGKSLDVPRVLTYHNDIIKNTINLFLKAYNNLVGRSTLKLSNLIITPSPYCYRESNYLRNFKNKVVWIPPGVDINRYSVEKSYKLHDRYGIPHDSKIILFVGVLSKAHTHKGVDILIKAFKEIAIKNRRVYLVLVGGGDMIPKYKKICNSLGLNRAIFTGFVDDLTLIEYYKSSDVVVLPSKTIQEGFGMVLIEANACGKPVIGSKVGGIKYVIRDGENGLLAPPKNPKALADAIIYILENENAARKMGRRGRRIVEREYTWKKSAEKTKKVFEDVINNANI